MIKLIIDESNKIGYTIKKVNDKKYQLCRILKEYDNEEDCENDLIAVVVNEKDEDEL